MALYGLNIDKKKYEISILTKGMMCEHCESMVIKAVNALPNIINVKASSGTGEVCVTAKGKPDVESITATVKNLGYTVISWNEPIIIAED